MPSTKINLNQDKPNIMVIGNPPQVRKLNVPTNLKLDDSDTNLLIKSRIFGVVLNDGCL